MTNLPDLVGVLAAVDRELRLQHKAIFKKVDKIKAKPGWMPFREQGPPAPFKDLPRGPCAMCGRNSRYPTTGKCRPCTRKEARERMRRKRAAQKAEREDPGAAHPAPETP